jgi:hypothetical protein
MINICGLLEARFRVLYHAKIVLQNGIAEEIACPKHPISHRYLIKEMPTDAKSTRH